MDNKKNNTWKERVDEVFIDHKDSWGVNVIGYGVTKRKLKNFIQKELTDTFKAVLDITKRNWCDYPTAHTDEEFDNNVKLTKRAERQAKEVFEIELKALATKMGIDT